MREYKASLDLKSTERETPIQIVERTCRDNMEDAIGWAKGVEQFLRKYYPFTKLIKVEEA